MFDKDEIQQAIFEALQPFVGKTLKSTEVKESLVDIMGKVLDEAYGPAFGKPETVRGRDGTSFQIHVPINDKHPIGQRALRKLKEAGLC